MLPLRPFSNFAVIDSSSPIFSLSLGFPKPCQLLGFAMLKSFALKESSTSFLKPATSLSSSHLALLELLTKSEGFSSS
ncbi:hypothetical protein ACOSQ3_020716 [Xanthoceras sorbifolium]